MTSYWPVFRQLIKAGIIGTVCLLAFISFLVGIAIMREFTAVSKAQFAEEQQLFEHLCASFQNNPDQTEATLTTGGASMVLAECETLTSIRKYELSTDEAGRPQKYMLVTIKNRDGSYSQINALFYVYEDTIWKLSNFAFVDSFDEPTLN